MKKNRNFQYFLIICLVSIVLLLVLENSRPKYIKINSEEAKEIITEEENYIIIDMRSKKEYKNGHIPNSINMPYSEITEEKILCISEFSTFMIVYGDNESHTKDMCKKMLDAGYNFVYDLGNIDNWEYNLVK